MIIAAALLANELLHLPHEAAGVDDNCGDSASH